MPKSEKGDNSVTYSQGLRKVNQVIYIMYPNCMPDIMILAQAVLYISSWSLLIFLLYSIYFVDKLLYDRKCQSRKSELIQPNIYRILTKVNQVIYTMATFYMPNVMILLLIEAVLQIYCWQVSIGLQCVSRKRELIQSNIQRILRKVNQVIYILNTICVSNTMITAKAVLQNHYWQGTLCVKCLSLKRGIIQSNSHRIVWNVNQVIFIVYLNCIWLMPLSFLKWFSRYFVDKLLYYTKCQSRKREIILSNIYIILPSTPWAQSVRQTSWS